MAGHFEIVDGLELPAKLSGHPALDFCNTLSGWDGRDPWDYLLSYDHLAVWAGFTGLLPGERVSELRRQAGRRATAAATALEEARAQRARLYELLGGSDCAFASVAADASAAAAGLRLIRKGDAIRWEIDPAAGLHAPHAAIAWATAELLTSPDRGKVRVCPGHACGWLFLDRRGRRRWCTMATCGNRAKVRRFASRHRETNE